MRNVVVDLEVYSNLFIVGMMDVDTKRFVSFDHTQLDALRRYVASPLTKPVFITFNGIHYDLRILRYALAHYDKPELLTQLKMFSDHIIDGAHADQKETFDNFWWPDANIDLKQILGGKNCPSLKKLAYRLHLAELETLPVAPDKWLTEDEKRRIITYNKVDVKNTLALYHYCAEALNLRTSLTNLYGVNCTNLSDAQIAERIVAENAPRCQAFDVGPVRPLKFIMGEFNFESPPLRAFHKRLSEDVGFKFEQGFNPIKKRPYFKKHFIENGQVVKSFKIEDMMPRCEFAFGGLHSIHKSPRQTIAGTTAYDVDVVSYYPELIIKFNILDERFRPRYKEILERRVAAKKSGRQVEQSALKIVLNSTFGHLSQYYSRLRNPMAGARVCILGQLCLLRLIDICWKHGIDCLMANTDGVLTRQSPRSAVAEWQDELQMPLEVKEVDKFFISDSNNHILRYKDGSPSKIKGSAFSYEPSVNKQTPFPIVQRAIVDFLLDGVPLEKTILSCIDPYQMLGCYATGPSILQVKSAIDADDIGSIVPPVVRYYYGHSGKSLFRRNVKGWTRIADTENHVMLNKVSGMPSDVNYAQYIEKAKDKLKKIAGTR